MKIHDLDLLFWGEMRIINELAFTRAHPRCCDYAKDMGTKQLDNGIANPLVSMGSEESFWWRIVEHSTRHATQRSAGARESSHFDEYRLQPSRLPECVVYTRTDGDWVDISRAWREIIDFERRPWSHERSG